MIKRKDIIILYVLNGILFALILIFALLVAPLLYEDEAGREPPVTMDGEYTNGATLSLYTPIDDSNLLEITVKNPEGEYSFVRQEKDGKTSMVIKGHEKVSYDQSVYAYLYVFAKDPKVPLDGTVIRNLSKEQMAEYGTTEELCQAKVTVKYKSGNEEKTHELYIGKSMLTSTGGNYVSVKGRSHVYCVNAIYYDNALSKGITAYISPAIFAKYKNASEAGLAIKEFVILKSNQVGDVYDTVVLIKQDETVLSTSNSATYKFSFPDFKDQEIIASSDYVLGVFGQLYMEFVGDSVVALDPDDATLEKYGLGKNQEQYMIYAFVKDESDTNFIPAIYVSKEFIEGEGENAVGYHYVMSGFHAEVTIVKIPSEQLYFLRDDTEAMLAWAATNSIYSGFSEYLRPEPEIYAPGVKTLRIKTLDYDLTFYMSINSNGLLTVKTEDGKYSFTDNINATGYDVNQFSNLYTLLLYYPMPTQYTTLSKEEANAAKSDDKIIYQLEVELYDGTLRKYTYYTLNEGYSGYALCESMDGKINDNGEKEYGVSQTVFEVKSRHISLIAQVYKIILEGGTINPMDYIY